MTFYFFSVVSKVLLEDFDWILMHVF